jgi:hypothetical protein
MRSSSTRTVLKSRPWDGTGISRACWSSLSGFDAEWSEQSRLQVDDEVEVVGMGPEDECAHEMFVLTPWQPRPLAVPLMQLEVIQGEDATREAVEDWQYWLERGYEL